jgi:hypothetical protein
LNSIVDTILPLLGIGLLGYLAARLSLFSDQSAEGLARFVFDFAVPILLLRVFVHADLPDNPPWALWAAFYAPLALAYTLGLLVSVRLFGLSSMAGIIGGFSASFGNSVLLGLPLVMLTFGREGTVPYFILVSVHSLSVFTVTTVALEIGRQRGQPPATVLRGVVRGLVGNPIIVSIVAGIAMNRLGLGLPGPVDRLAEHMELAVTPCALFSIGVALTRYGIVGQLGPALATGVVKIVLMPLAVWLTGYHLLGLSPLWAMVATLLAAQPCGVNTYLFAVRYQAGIALASTAVFLTTIASIVTVSAWLWFFEDIPIP